VRLLDPTTVDINPFYEDVLALESEATSYRQQVNKLTILLANRYVKKCRIIIELQWLLIRRK